jgi:hypothetical protein
MSSGPIQIHFDEDLAQNRNTNVAHESMKLELPFNGRSRENWKKYNKGKDGR